MTHAKQTLIGLLGCGLALWGLTLTAAAQDAPATQPALQDRTDVLPPELEEVGIDAKLGNQLPLDTEFVDQNGNKVKLRQYFDGKRPVILTLNYFRCPMLCGVMLNDLLTAMQEMKWTVGDEYEVVTISFDSGETYQMANVKRQNYLSQYGRRAKSAVWPFLTSGLRQKNIDAMLEATGFRIKQDPATKQWAHAAALIICTPDGHISRYLYGLAYDAQTVRLSLVEASEGKVGSPVDQILLFCYHFEDGKYTFAAMNVMRAGGTLTLIVLAGLIFGLWRRNRRKQLATTGAHDTEPA